MTEQLTLTLEADDALARALVGRWTPNRPATAAEMALAVLALQLVPDDQLHARARNLRARADLVAVASVIRAARARATWHPAGRRLFHALADHLDGRTL